MVGGVGGGGEVVARSGVKSFDLVIFPLPDA